MKNLSLKLKRVKRWLQRSWHSCKTLWVKNLIKHDRKYKFHFATNDPAVAQEYKDVMGAGVEIRGPEGDLLGIRIQERTSRTLGKRWASLFVVTLVPTLTTRAKSRKRN